MPRATVRQRPYGLFQGGSIMSETSGSISGLTDEEAVGRMRANIDVGRFTRAHYREIWTQRVAGAGVETI